MRMNNQTYDQLVEQFKEELLADDYEMEQIEQRLEERLANRLRQEDA